MQNTKNQKTATQKNANVKTTNAKTSTTKKVDNKKKEENKIVNLNLTQFAGQLKDVTVKEKKDKSTIYLYPDTFSKSDINSEKGKKFRNSLRNKMQKFENNIFVFTKTNDSEKLIECIKEFNAFYKANYALNDYSLKSLSSSNDEAKNQSLIIMLNIIKTVNETK